LHISRASGVIAAPNKHKHKHISIVEKFLFARYSVLQECASRI